MSLHIGNMYIIECQSIRSQMNGIFDGKVSIQNIKVHRCICHYCTIQIQSLELAIKMHLTCSASFYIISDASHIVFEELQIQFIRFNIQIKSALRFQRINNTRDVRRRRSNILDKRIQPDSSILIVPFTIYIQISQSSLIEREILYKQTSIHDRFLQHTARVCRSRSISLKIYIIRYTGNIKHISHIDILQVNLDRVFRIVRQTSVDTHITVLMAEIEIVHIHLSRIHYHLRRMYFPKRVIQYNISRLHVYRCL